MNVNINYQKSSNLSYPNLVASDAELLPQKTDEDYAENKENYGAKTVVDGAYKLNNAGDIMMLQGPNIIRICSGNNKNLNEKSISFLHHVGSCSELEFRNMFHMNRTTALLLVDEYSDHVDATKTSNVLSNSNVSDISLSMSLLEENTENNVQEGGVQLPAKLQMYATLWYLATSETLSSISHRLDITLQTAYKSIFKSIQWILKDKLPQHVKWPNAAERTQIKQAFEGVKGVTNVIGALGCYHIKIPEPRELQHSYFNKRRFYSVRMQVVVDHRGKFTDVTIGNHGAMHDSNVLRESKLAHNIRIDFEQLMGEDSIILGGVLYPSTYKWLVTPYRNNKHSLTMHQLMFNYLHAYTRICADDAFANLTNRFQKIDSISVNNHDFIKGCVMTACLLHNFCIDNNDLWPSVDSESRKRYNKDIRRDQLFHDLLNDGKLGN